MDYGPVDLVLMRERQSSNMAMQDAAMLVEVDQEIST